MAMVRKKDDSDSIERKKTTIGEQNEKSLHSEIKRWYACEGDRLEERVGGYIVDIVRENLLIEIQTRNFGAIRDKLKKLVSEHNVRLVYPVPREKWIVRESIEDGGRVSRRKSPKSGSHLDIFDVLVSMPGLIEENNFEIEILLVSQEDVWRNDGRGSWRRKGASIVDKKLLDVGESIIIRNKKDFLSMLPDALPDSFTNKDLAREMGITVGKARKITYCLKKMNAIKETGKLRNELVFEKLLV
jgi:hypothetical protein